MIEPGQRYLEKGYDSGLTDFFASIGNRVIASGTHLWGPSRPSHFLSAAV